MKTKNIPLLIAINWLLSFTALSIDLDRTSFRASVLILGWFFGSTFLFIYNIRKGRMKEVQERADKLIDKIMELLKINE